MSEVEGLPGNIESAPVWSWFEQLLRIPRPSGHEEKVADFLCEFASGRSLAFERDGNNNVLIRKSGAGAPASGQGMILQAHVDIVAEKTMESAHDFLTDPITAVVEGDWVTAKETTLGADNGIGVALILALLDSDRLGHPPLECLFTVDEERGLVGASGFPAEWLTSGRMINLDSEDDSSFCIGCAGGTDISLTGKVARGPAAPGSECFTLSVHGLRGGHSGLEIGMGRACAISLLARAVDGLLAAGDLRIKGLRGGSKRNAIPRFAEAQVVIPVRLVPDAESIVSDFRESVRREYAGTEEGIEIQLDPVAVDTDPLSEADTRRLNDLLMVLPHGVHKMSGTVEDLVETSDNLAMVSLLDDAVRIDLSVRSSLEEAKEALASRIEACARLSGFAAGRSGGYPGWTPDPDSPLLAAAVRVFRDLNGRDPLVEAVHAGLECGLIGSRAGGLDMISLGPDIRDVHVPGERISISSLERFWGFLTVLLQRLD